MHVVGDCLACYHIYYKSEAKYFHFDAFFIIQRIFSLIVKLEACLENPHRLEGKIKLGFHSIEIN